MTIGQHIKNLRMVRGMGQRELARRVGVSPSYINDIENGKKKVPSRELLKKVSRAIGSDLEYMLDLAAIEVIKRRDLGNSRANRLVDFIEGGKMKAIIIAAGKGSRMKHYTEELPKCMLKFGGKTLLEKQLEALRANGIKDIVVIKGYKKEKINYPELKYYVNERYEHNNILNSLFCAEPEINSNVIISYSDILYEKEVVARLMESKHDISIVADVEWRSLYKGREDHPVQEAENVIINPDNKLVEIGKILARKHDVHGEFIGMMKLTRRGADIFKKHFNSAKQLYWGREFIRAETFENAYLTDMIQYLVDMGVDVHCVIIKRGWREIDTVGDYERALKEFKEA